MSTSVTMPQLGESVTEGTITRWLKQVGDTVAVDEPLVEISTDKVDTEIPSPAAGVLTEIHANEDDTVEIGGALATIGEGDDGAAAAAADGGGAAAADGGGTAASDAAPAAVEPDKVEPAHSENSATAVEQSSSPQTASQPVAPPSAAPPPTAARPATQAASNPAANVAVDASAKNGAAYVTPLVRKLAGEHNVDISTLTGTGVGGRVRKQDILEAAQQAAQRAAEQSAKKQGAAQSNAAAQGPSAAETVPLRGRTEKLSRLRALIGRRMVESLQTSAQLTCVVEVDVSKIARMREEAKVDFQTRNGVKLSFLPFFAIAAVEALAEHPKLNSSVDSEAGTITYHAGAHLGMAVDTERGLVVPVIRNAGDLNLTGLARKIADLADRARENKLTPDELAGGTFTLTNTGSRGSLFDTPILNQPQVAILGTGAVVKRAVVVDDADLGELILPRSMVYLSLTYDHRVVDGADAARYLVSVKDRLEAAAFDVELGLN